MLIYVADLAHDYFRMTQFTPTGIGYVAAHVKKKFGERIGVRLFKSPTKLLDAIDQEQPDILGLSNYTWNTGLNRFVGSYVKSTYPRIPIVMGGPNIQVEEKGIERMLRRDAYVDKHVLYAGEPAFTEIVTRLLDVPERQRDAAHLRAMLVDGCYSIHEGRLEGNTRSTILDDLDETPSPFLNGMMNPFLDAGALPIIETNRGCPFSCTFCVWGISALSKVRKFSMQRVKDELNYVAHYPTKVPVIVFGDANFGILPRDVEIAQHVRKLYEETKSFSRVHLYWAKIAKPHMVDIGKALGHLTQTYVAFQSLDPEVLANIKRRNIRTDELVKLIDQLQEFTDAAQTDILVGLPGETYDSHLRSLDSALDLGINLIHGGEIRMLPGSEMDSEETRTTFAIKTKYRFFEGGYGMYRGQFVYELEEGIRATSTMSEEEMLKLRALRAFFYAGVTLGEHLPLVSYLRTRGIRFTRVCEQMVNEGLADPRFGPSVRWLIETSRNEWHATEEAAADYVAQGENRRGLLEDSMFVKLNTGFLAKIYLEPEQYMAYYDVLARVITKLDPTVDQQVLGELLDICRNRNYLIKCLRGDFASTRLTFEISRATQEVLVEAQFLTEQDAQLNPGKISLSVNPTTAEFCATYVKDHPRMNNMELSQVLLLQAGRFLMKPRKRAESRLTADHLITMPAEVS